MVLYALYNGACRASEPCLALDACSNYAACISSQTVKAHLRISRMFGGVVEERDYSCGNIETVSAPGEPGFYLVDVTYTDTQTNANVGVDRMLLAVDSAVSEVDWPQGYSTGRMIVVDPRYNVSTVLALRRGERIAIPNGVLSAVTLVENGKSAGGCLVAPSGDVACGNYVRIRRSIEFDSVDSMVNWVVQRAAMVEPDAQIWTCALRGYDPGTVTRALAPLALLDVALQGATITRIDVDVENRRIEYEALLRIGELRGWLAILSDVSFGCAAGAMAAVWLAGIGAVAGCVVGAAVGFTVGIVFHAHELYANVDAIYRQGVANVNSAVNTALGDLEKLREQGAVSDKAYEIMKRDIEYIRSAALESLKSLRDAQQIVEAEVRSKYMAYVAAAAIGGLALGALLKR